VGLNGISRCVRAVLATFVWDPLTGEKALLVVKGGTAGARIVAEFAVEEGGFVPGGEHVHDNCSEHLRPWTAGSRSWSTARSDLRRREDSNLRGSFIPLTA
jgi:hypothetical protein